MKGWSLDKEAAQEARRNIFALIKEAIKKRRAAAQGAITTSLDRTANTVLVQTPPHD